MSNPTTTVSAGFPVTSILGIAFIVLKLTGYISWSWVWVLAPFWAPIALVGVCLMIMFIGAIIFAFFKK